MGHPPINRLARIWGIDRTIALTTAKHEAHLRDLFKEKDDQAEEMKHRRRWDCFHIATAQTRECTHLYTTDPHFSKRQKQLSLTDVIIAPPKPTAPLLPFAPTPAFTLVK